MEEQQPASGNSRQAVGVERVLLVLKELARAPEGVGLDEMATRVGGAKTTVHRALSALCNVGLARRMSHGEYALGEEFVRLAFEYQGRRSDVALVRPVLERLCEWFTETTHYAVLDGHDVVYRAKVDPPDGAIRLTSTIGGRNPAHRTAVGKLLIAHRLPTREDFDAWIDGYDLEARTPSTLTDPEDLWGALVRTREEGFAVDDQENETGLVCIALPVYLESATVPTGAISISAVAFRTPLADLLNAASEIRAVIDEHLGAETA